MDSLVSTNLLEAVQLVPIFSYLTMLSDFLYINDYLLENDQTKQIPVVNALYEYLHDHQGNQPKNIKLIRFLLKGSDLYGERKNEEIDVTFVNAMFNYIISSLVFDKYGNIYGFLAQVFLKAENLQVDYVHEVIKENLQDASFENEWGDNSNLTSLSVSRIYNDIVLPLFPQPKANMSLLSLDYIYAQAGSMFLSPGRINATYYGDSMHRDTKNLKEDNLFQEYLLTGHIIGKLILTEEKNLKLMKAFALPALTYHIFNSKYLFVYLNVEHIISDSNFWQTAYKNLFQYTNEAHNNASVQLNNDYIWKMRLALSSFQSRAAMAKIFIDVYCDQFNATWRVSKLSEYLNNPEHFECKIEKPLPNLNLRYTSQITEIGNVYKKYALPLIQKAFGESLINCLKLNNVIIKLLHVHDKMETSDFSEFKTHPYNVLQFYFPKTGVFSHYVLRQENSNVILINEYEDPQLFQQTIGMTFEKFLADRILYKVLKTVDENIDTFWENLMDYKRRRLEVYLKFLDTCQGKSELWENKWWKEFGLPLQPFNLSLPGFDHKDACEITEIIFMDSPEDVAPKKIQTETQSLLSSLGTTITSLSLREICDEVLIEEHSTTQQDYKVVMKSILNRNDVFENISFHIEEPAFELTSITRDSINLIERTINVLISKTNFGFNFVISYLHIMAKLKSNIYKSVGFAGENKSQVILVNSVDGKSDIGYGYKFTFINADGVPKTVLLRTESDLKNEVFVLQIPNDAAESIKRYMIINNETFKPENDSFLYEVDNQLRRKVTKYSFAGISIYHDDDLCNDYTYFANSKSSHVCLRHWRFKVKKSYEEEAVKFVKSRTRFPEKQIRDTLNRFSFPDNATLSLFVNKWLENNLEPFWIEVYGINNPDLLNTLRYTVRLEKHDVANNDGIFRINSFYSRRERRKIEEDKSIEDIIKDFNVQKASYSVTFHDYYAIRNFVTTGFSRIMEDSHEAKLMKLALYKLAIRQSEDPDSEFELKLFRVESKPFGYTKKLFQSNNSIILKKFTTAYPNVVSATRFATYPVLGFRNILYEMTFVGPYLRGKVEQFYNEKEKMVILLPGMEFSVVNKASVDIEGLGNVLKVKLHVKYYDDKHRWYKRIMNEIARITF